MSYQKLIDRINEIIALGERVMSTRRPSPPHRLAGDYVDRDPFHRWKASSLSYLRMVFGEEHTHFRLFLQGCQHPSLRDASTGHQILLAAKEDIEGGYLKALESLVSADIFADFLDMAQYLHEEGYKDPAASLAGAVLEDGLRRIAKSKDVTLKSTENIDSLNQKLVDAKTYNRLTFSKVRVWNQIRDKADHGHFDQYDADDVSDMIQSVRSFLEEYV